MTRLQQWRASFYSRGGNWVLVQFPLLLLALLIPWWTAGSPAHPVVQGAGWALMLAGMGLFVAAASTLGRYFTPFPEPLPRSGLRTDGVFSLVRHPTYTGVLCLSLGWSLVNNSLWGGLLTLVLFAFFDRKAVHEEQWLGEKFPDYQLYRQRVRKLIPLIY